MTRIFLRQRRDSERYRTARDFELKVNYCCRETKLNHCCLLQDDSVAQEADLFGKLNHCCLLQDDSELNHCCLLQDDSVAQEADLLGNVATARDFGRQVLSLLALLVQKYKY